MNHHRAMLLIVGTGVGQIKALRQVVVDLDGSQLPLPPNYILNHKIDFGSVKSSLPRLLTRLYTKLLRRLFHRLLRFVPTLFRSNIFI